MTEITEQDLLAAGYKRFDHGRPELHKGSSWYLARSVTDETGMRYGITVYYHEIRSHRVGIDTLLSPQTQFREEGVCPVTNVSLSLGEFSSVEEMEAHLDRIWQSLGRPYCKRYD